MRYLLSVLLASALLLGSGSVHAQIKHTESEISGAERWESTGMRALHDKQYAGHHASLRAQYVNHPEEGVSWVVSFYGFTTDTTQVSRSNEFVVAADGKNLEPIRLTSKTRSLDDMLLEIKRAVFTRSGFESIATAKTVTISIGSAQFQSIRPHRRDLRLILDRVPAQQGPATAGGGPSGK